MGEACVRAFVAAGSFVTFGDVNDRGKEIEKELNDASGQVVCAFVRVDIRDWDQQKSMFETARSKSPNNSVDIVIANAGISRSSGDSLWNLDGKSELGVIRLCTTRLTQLLDPDGEPTKPNLNIIKVNLDGSLYTWKLAVHYFRKQPDTPERDRCFIITGSMVAWIDSPVNTTHISTFVVALIIADILPVTGQLGVHCDQVRATWIHAHCKTIKLGTGNQDQLRCAVLDQKCYTYGRVRKVASGQGR